VNAPGAHDVLALTCLAAAVLHGLGAGHIAALAGRWRWRRSAGLLHLLGEVEHAFVFWALVLLLGWGFVDGPAAVWRQLTAHHFGESLFVFIALLVVSLPPLREAIGRLTVVIGRRLPGGGATGFYFTTLAVLPLLGSLITEVAAMSVAALVLRDRLFASPLSTMLRYATLGVLFVNVSIGGVLTHFAAPAVLMVAEHWGWGIREMLLLFGGRAAAAVVFNAAVATLLFHRELAAVPLQAARAGTGPLRAAGLLRGLWWREASSTALFLGALVILGSAQGWWLQPLLADVDERVLFYGAALLTSVTDNAALTYLGSVVSGLDAQDKVSLVAGAVAGGGLTVIANAPNPAGAAILRGAFPGGRISPLRLLLAALPPTLVAVLAFRL
jgi:hypothetical protein